MRFSSFLMVMVTIILRCAGDTFIPGEGNTLPVKWFHVKTREQKHSQSNFSLVLNTVSVTIWLHERLSQLSWFGSTCENGVARKCVQVAVLHSCWTPGMLCLLKKPLPA